MAADTPSNGHSPVDTQQIQPRAYRVSDFCATYGVSRATLYKLIKEGKIRKAKIAGRTVIPADEAEALLRRGTG
jgi:excisionase family DNA binding protein